MSTEFSKKEMVILELLDTPPRRGWYGSELVKNSEGELGMGTVYVHLAKLEDNGYVSSERIPPAADAPVGMPPRRKYHLTDNGRRMWLSQKNAQNTTSGGWSLPGLSPA